MDPVFTADIEYGDITSEGLLRASSFKGLTKGTGRPQTRFNPMKFLEWVESVDYLVIPVSVDIGLSVFTAGLATALLRYVFELAV